MIEASRSTEPTVAELRALVESVHVISVKALDGCIHDTWGAEDVIAALRAVAVLTDPLVRAVRAAGGTITVADPITVA